MSQYLADELRQIADSKQNKISDKAVEQIVGVVIERARQSAIDGSYSYRAWDNRLSTTAVAQGVIKSLSNHGFTVDVVKTHEPAEFPAENYIYVEVKW